MNAWMRNTVQAIRKTFAPRKVIVLRERSEKFAIAGYCVGAGIFGGVGVVNLYKYIQRRSLANRRLEVLKEPAVDLNVEDLDLGNLEYKRKYRAYGRLDLGGLHFVGPRPGPGNTEDNPVQGFQVVAPFYLDSSLVFVDLGWISSSSKLAYVESNLTEFEKLSEPVEITMVHVRGESKGTISFGSEMGEDGRGIVRFNMALLGKRFDVSDPKLFALCKEGNEDFNVLQQIDMTPVVPASDSFAVPSYYNLNVNLKLGAGMSFTSAMILLGLKFFFFTDDQL